MPKRKRSEGSQKISFDGREGEEIFSISRSKYFKRVFYSSLSIEADEDNIDHDWDNPSSSLVDEKQVWNVAIGDAVCAQNKSSKRCDSFIEKNFYRLNPWSPFNQPWSPCQILSIFQDVSSDESKVRSSLPKVEVRWLFRRSNISLDLNEINNDNSSEFEDIWETDCVEEIEMDRIMGLAEIFDENTANFRKERRHPNPTIPPVKHTFRGFYAIKDAIIVKVMQPAQNALGRALNESLILKKHRDLMKIVYNGLDLENTNDRGDSEIEPLSHKSGSILLNSNQSNEEYIVFAERPIPWKDYVHGDRICPTYARNPKWLWKVFVGDIVAVNITQSSKPYNYNKNCIWFPYNIPWSPCQVLSIHRRTTHKGNHDGTLIATVCWLYRVGDFTCSKKPPESHQIFETDDTSEISVSSILGLVTLRKGKNHSRKYSADLLRRKEFPLHTLPITELSLGTGIYLKASHSFQKKHVPFENIFERGISSILKGNHKKEYLTWLDDEFRNIYGKKDDVLALEQITTSSKTNEKSKSRKFERNRDIPGILTSPKFTGEKSTINKNAKNELGGDPLYTLPSQNIREENPRIDQDNNDEPERFTTTCLPYHIDKSSRKAFYSSIDILPPFLSYDSQYHGEKYESTPPRSKSIRKWNVKLGDIVAVHCSNTLKFQAQQDKNYHPFCVPWGIGEIVSIYMNISPEDTLAMQSRTGVTNDAKVKSFGLFVVELRWFYEKADISGTTTGVNLVSKENGDKTVEEILESDECLEVMSNTLLAPVKMYSDPIKKTCPLPVNSLGMPVVEFFCNKLWSVHRKSLVPVGTDKNRFDRGMLYSKYLGRDKVTRSAFENIRNPTEAPLSRPSLKGHDEKWSERFHDAIEKLTLTDASEKVQIQGSALVGREKEQNEIYSYLKSSICGINDLNSIYKGLNYSLFVAGPPGTGKTASVRYVISRLQKDQAEGKIPSFEFVGLNGMEMRHPFDAYVRLCESITPNKERLSPGNAISRLESLFGGSADKKISDVEEKKQRSIIVCLLDEIDYLVTKKQTVLYNFFDWPVRGSQCNSSAQLIVIGISNTLNLPERLHPRVRSRLGDKRSVFKAYGVEDTIMILKSRLNLIESSDSSIFHPDAVTFAARKTARESGDIRKAFHLCKTAAETVFSDITSGRRRFESVTSHLVGISDIQKASRDMFSTIIHKAVTHSTSFEALLFVALASLKRHSGREHDGFEAREILTKMRSVATASGEEQYLPPPTCSELLGLLNRLGEAKVVLCQTPHGSRTLVSLQLEDYEVMNALKTTAHAALAEKNLSRSLFL
mmetsp:Transcript_16620/g.23590  ORF Transcript_16620/g.23590 Transcript_16620/m.23590 type:complete len:1299 (+) Transcript_16620:102-3998(+)|eukprot:CAMPEP_0184861088 /NCGR_PEP_ID=MMETSP0580-20130426/5859_1 /TAXON_ID=1118495 /ORGANISM="Dactyliosolen fragilissimus" /LENGTH=1298 /DNA_ID=CAMNT_0027358457 /DNA_START=57 /DNA_END=3953 /DNA_ORIENTATION=-